MKCPDLENPLNGRVNVNKQTLDSTAKYKCNEGFVLNGGDHVRKCLAGGGWSGKAPLCKCKFICIIFWVQVPLCSRHVAVVYMVSGLEEFHCIINWGRH